MSRVSPVLCPKYPGISSILMRRISGIENGWMDLIVLCVKGLKQAGLFSETILQSGIKTRSNFRLGCCYIKGEKIRLRS